MRRNEKKVPAAPPPDLAVLAERAKEAARAALAQRAAFEEERKAEIALLRRVVEAVRPALPAIVTRTGAGWRGALVAEESGTTLYLSESGNFVEIRPAGTERAFAGVAEVLVDWDPEVIIRELATLVEAQIKGRAGSAADARLRAARLNEVTKMLE